MKLKITYKEITLALGILVAVLVMLTLWSGKPAAEETKRTVAIPSISLPRVTTHAIEVAVDVLF